MTEILRVALFYNNKVFLYVECRPLKAASNKVVSAAKGKPQNRNFLKTKASIYMSSYFISTVHQGMKVVGMNLNKLNAN